MTAGSALTRSCYFVAAGIFALVGQCAETSAGRTGVALLIANGGYKDAELPSVREDQRQMGLALKSLGFDVAEVHDLARPQDFDQEISAFLKEKNAAPEDILLIYYSGHGLQIDGEPQVLGTGMTASQQGSLREYSKPVNEIIKVMENAAPSAWVLIVDACRNNPFAGSSHKAGISLDQNDEDAYVLFADEPGRRVPARVENGLESPFTAALLYAFETSSEGLSKRFEIAREKTQQLNSDQTPVMYQSRESPNRSRPFLDKDGRAAPSDSAVRMLAEAERLYGSRSWKPYLDLVVTARTLSTSAVLSARLDKEIQFARLVLSAEEAQKIQTIQDGQTPPSRFKKRARYSPAACGSRRRPRFAGFWEIASPKPPPCSLNCDRRPIAPCPFARGKC